MNNVVPPLPTSSRHWSFFAHPCLVLRRQFSHSLVDPYIFHYYFALSCETGTSNHHTQDWLTLYTSLTGSSLKKNCILTEVQQSLVLSLPDGNIISWVSQALPWTCESITLTEDMKQSFHLPWLEWDALTTGQPPVPLHPFPAAYFKHLLPK